MVRSCNPMSTRLALFTVLPAVDGTLFSLAATGAFASPLTSGTVGLTVIAGAGAWLSAREEFGPWSPRHRRRFWTVALVSAALSVGAILLGAIASELLELRALPAAAAAALALLGLAVAGLRLPEPLRIPLAAWAVLVGAAVEVALAWTS